MLSICGWGWTFASHTTATGAPQLTLVVFTALYARELQVGQQDVMFLTTWLLVAMLQLKFPSLKSQPAYSDRMGNDQMASHWSLGRAASHYVGTSRSLANWLSHMLTEHLTGQVQQQSWQPLAKRTNMLILALVISLSSLPLRH